MRKMPAAEGDMTASNNESENMNMENAGKAGLDFSRPYAVEFYSVLRSQVDATVVAMQYLKDLVKDGSAENVMIHPCTDGGVEIVLVKEMLVTRENISEIENKLAEKLSTYDGYLNGWRIIRD